MRKFDIDKLIKTIRKQELTLATIAMLTRRLDKPSRKGLSPSGILRVINKQGNPTLKTIELLCAAVKVDPANFFIGDIPAKMDDAK